MNLQLSAHAIVVHTDVCNMFISRCTTGRTADSLRPATQARQTSRRSLHVFACMTSTDDAVAAGPTDIRREIGVIHRQVVSIVDGGHQATHYAPAELHVYVCHLFKPLGYFDIGI